MASWDDEDFDDAPEADSNGIKLSSKWDGEDEEVADAWDAEDDDSKPETTDASGELKKRRKNMKDIIKEREEKRLADLERKKQEAKEAAEQDEMTPEQIRLAQEESDLLLAKETFGVTEPAVSLIDMEKSIDHQDPKTQEDFERLHVLIRDKLLKYEKSPHFPMLMENIFRDISLNQDADFLRKLSTMFAAMANEKVKQMRSKTKKKGAGKGKIATIRDNDFQQDANAEYDELDDFI